MEGDLQSNNGDEHELTSEKPKGVLKKSKFPLVIKKKSLFGTSVIKKSMVGGTGAPDVACEKKGLRARMGWKSRSRSCSHDFAASPAR